MLMMRSAAGRTGYGTGTGTGTGAGTARSGSGYVYNSPLSYSGGADGRAAHNGSSGGAAGSNVHNDDEPYRLRAVGHSLGGACLLIYASLRSAAGQATHMHRIILLTPAGFHIKWPAAVWPIVHIFPWIVRFWMWVWPHFAMPFYIPTFLARALTFKILQDVRNIPGLCELFNMCVRLMLGGDISQWDSALELPHYSAAAMPAVSMHQVLHMVQMARSKKFQLFDYGSPQANAARYNGQRTPPDVAAMYAHLRMPVELMAGRHDGIISKDNVRQHYQAMKAAGVQVSYREFDYGHLDFTLAAKEELKLTLMKMLRKSC